MAITRKTHLALVGVAQDLESFTDLHTFSI